MSKKSKRHRRAQRVRAERIAVLVPGRSYTCPDDECPCVVRYEGSTDEGDIVITLERSGFGTEDLVQGNPYVLDRQLVFGEMFVPLGDQLAKEILDIND